MKYDEAIRLEPGNYKYYFQRGKCQYTMKDVEMAINSFKATVQYQPNFTPAYSLLAKIYKTENDFDNAIYYYEQATAFHEDQNHANSEADMSKQPPVDSENQTNTFCLYNSSFFRCDCISHYLFLSLQCWIRSCA